MEPFRAYRIHDDDGAISGRLDMITLDDLSPGDVVIRAAYSGINYKDVLASTGKAKIARRCPMVGGIDVSGRVHTSTDPRYREGDAVVVLGCGLSETHDGGYAEFVRVPADWLMRLSEDAMTFYEAMAIGTAGFTAAMAIDRMEHNGQKPDQGPILVTGATGGVGSFAIDLLAARGYQVVALTGKRSADEYLHALGATDILYRDELAMGTRSLEKGQWAGAIDNLGGDVLAWLTRTVKPNGNIASVGNVAGAELVTTVMPFILRGVNLLGINSVTVSSEYKEKIWRSITEQMCQTGVGEDEASPDRPAKYLRRPNIDRIFDCIVPLESLPAVFNEKLLSEVRGRTVVEIAEL